MLNLTQNNNNLCTLELTCNSNYYTFSGIMPYYLFLFESDTTHQQIYFVSDNIAPISARTSYDQFIITESGSTFQNLTGGTIHLSPGFFWTYTIWEQLNQYNLNPALALDIVDTGRVMFSAGTSGIQYFQNSATTNFSTYTNY